jgi:hypothetical protein
MLNKIPKPLHKPTLHIVNIANTPKYIQNQNKMPNIFYKGSKNTKNVLPDSPK